MNNTITCDVCGEDYDQITQSHLHKHKSRMVWDFPVTVNFIPSGSKHRFLCHTYQRQEELIMQIINYLHDHAEIIPKNIQVELKMTAFRQGYWRVIKSERDKLGKPINTNILDEIPEHIWIRCLSRDMIRLISAGMEVKETKKPLRSFLKPEALIYTFFTKKTLFLKKV